MSHGARSSQSPGLQVNADGSVDLYFGPTAPESKETNLFVSPVAMSPLQRILRSLKRTGFPGACSRIKFQKDKLVTLRRGAVKHILNVPHLAG